MYDELIVLFFHCRKKNYITASSGLKKKSNIYYENKTLKLTNEVMSTLIECVI